MFCPYCGEKLPDGSPTCGACGKALPGAKQPKTPRHVSGRQILILAAAGVLLLLLAGGSLLLARPKQRPCLYLSGDYYSLLPELSGEAVEFTRARVPAPIPELVHLTEDGRFAYYLTRYDPTLRTGTLCRAELGKLRPDSGKNEAHLLTIARNVSPDLQVLSDGRVLYLTGGQLCLFDGEESRRVAEDVRCWLAGDDYVVYGRDDEDGLTVSGVRLAEPDKERKLASGVDELIFLDRRDNLVYTARSALYRVNYDQERELLAEDITEYARTEDRYYYYVDSGRTVDLVQVLKPWQTQTLRQTLRDADRSPYERPVRTLYCCSRSGDNRQLARDLVALTRDGDGAVFSTAKTLTAGADQSAATLREFEILTQLTYLGQPRYVNFQTGEVEKLSPEAAAFLQRQDRIGTVHLCFTEGRVYATVDDPTRPGQQELFSAPVKKHTAEPLTLVLDDARMLSAAGETMYAVSGGEQEGVDLYAVTDGAAARLLRGVDLEEPILAYEDGTVLAATEEGYSMASPAGPVLVLDETPRQLARLGEAELLCRTDGELLHVEGARRTILNTEVDYFWIKPPMEPVNLTEKDSSSLRSSE